MTETVIQTKTCINCSAHFTITNTDLAFYDKISPVFGEKKFSIPIPTLCPDCRQQRRLARRNERKLYKRTCDASGKQIITLYSPDKQCKVYDNPSYDGDGRDGLDYGREIDFSKTFLSQVQELLSIVPRKAIFVSKGHENSSYNNYVGNMKNCYLIFDSMESEDCLYGLKTSFDKYCIDCSYTLYSEHCYECRDCISCYELSYSAHCSSCKNSSFLFDCINCDHCFMCVGLQNKSYYIKNRQYTKEDYEKEIVKYTSLSSISLQSEFSAFKILLPHRNLFTHQVENCLGDNLENSRNCHACFDSIGIEDCKYSSRLINSQNCYDYESWGDKSTFIYDAIAI